MILRAGEAGVHRFAASLRIDAARRGHRLHASHPSVGKARDVAAYLLLRDGLGEEKSVGREDAQRNAEERVKRSDHVPQSVLVDEVLQANVRAEGQPLELAVDAKGCQFVGAHGARVTGAT